MKTNTNLLSDLTAVIETIRRRIEAHGNSIAENETRTRQSLIDPLLIALGWDVSDPVQVTLEYKTEQGKQQRADYALLHGNHPVAVIEAKKLNVLLEKHHPQAVSYAYFGNIKYMLVTNGDEWQMYDLRKPAGMYWEQRLLMQINISNEPMHQIALKVLRLWNINLTSGHEPVEAATPMLANTTKPETVQPKNTPEIIKPSAKIVDANESDWIALSDKQIIRSGLKGSFQVMYDSQSKKVANQTKFLISIINDLLIDKELLTTSDCPIILNDRGDKYFIHSEPEHANGEEFTSPQRLNKDLFIDSAINLKTKIKTLRELLKQFGVDPASVQIRLDSK